MTIQTFTVIRDSEQSIPETTTGELFVNDGFFAYTCEDLDRKLELDIGMKIATKSAIPRGRYKLIVSMSNRFKRRLPLLVAVPGFDGVRIHGGNTHLNTEGCVLVGKQRTSTGIRDCAERVDAIVKLIDDATNNGIASWIEIS